MKIVFVVPAFNEEKNIGRLLRNLQAVAGEVVVKLIIIVDDGSTDSTALIAEEGAGAIPVRVVKHSRNMGVGQVFRTGFLEAIRVVDNDDVIVTLEADNTSDLRILPEMVERIRAGSDIVLASCYAPGGGLVGSNGLRKLLSGVANRILRAIFPYPVVHTYSSFYRVYRPAILMAAMSHYGSRFIVEPGFVCAVEILLKIALLPARVEEVPMILALGERTGPSKMRIVRTILGYIGFIVRNFRLRWAMHAKDVRGPTSLLESDRVASTDTILNGSK